MRFVRITKSMEEVGKVILCTDVFSFIGATWEVGEGGLESTGTEQPGGKPESLIFPRTCWSFNMRTRESITVSAGWWWRAFVPSLLMTRFVFSIFNNLIQEASTCNE